jgi:hypothetical protein
MRFARDASLCLIAGLVCAAPCSALQSLPKRLQGAADTFYDEGARALVLKALALRDSAASGLLSYEARAIERTFVGMNVTRRFPLRARTLYHREQVAQVYWQSDGHHRIRWLGRREGKPVQGDDWSRRAPFGMDFDIAEELDLDDIGINLLFNPRGDRIDFFDADFVQPISAAGLALYRFASGDTIQIHVPSPGRTITLIEVTIQPRRRDWEALEGSLWFDRENGVLARAAFRPSDVWDHEVREPHDMDDVPGFLKPGIGNIESIVVEYGLFDQRWWLPRRVVGEGVFDWGDGLVRMPLTIEWTMSDHLVNEAPSASVTPGPGLVVIGRPERWDFVDRESIEYMSPPGVDLASTADLPPPLREAEIAGFSRDELNSMVKRIAQVAGPAPPPRARPFTQALLASLRYDRVRGLSAGYQRVVAASNWHVSASVRAATAVPDVYGSLAVSRGPFALRAYHDLADASDWNVAGMGNSMTTLLFGHDGGDYYRIDGSTLSWSAGQTPVRAQVEAFAERQRAISRQTNVSLATLGGGSLRPNLQASRTDVAGIRMYLAGQHGTDVQRTVFNWRIQAEAAVSEADYGRLATTLRLTQPFTPSLTAAIEVAAGMAGNGSPPQREFFLGGAGSLRGVRENAVTGPAFWMARMELGKGLPGLRAILFTDVGWAGVRGAFAKSLPTAGAGAGASFMDGLMRVDLARGALRSNAWRFYFYVDAPL